MIPNAKIMKLKREEETLENIKQVYISCKYPEDKYQAIATIYGLITVGKSVIFCQTRVDATFLASRLAGDTHSVALLHGELDESQRLHILNSFREGRAKILILTSAVQIRGMDFEQVTLVFNYDLPTDVNHQVDCDTYLHQIGRTGRFGRMGIAINLVTPEAMVYLSKIRSHFNKRIHKLDIDDIEEVEKLETYACIVE
ncbi:unnamed protein product [Orchesella dallaii]|uniref:Helicase C-terminal domain-containing protein n=1 Tax=Orchesella dallaii TaxID=48710 RepID=A0ABP1RT20_9HEXA